MAKKKNKGFSLIEIVIAIAILTLLLTPIIRQLTQTVRTNKKAKAQQYITNEATYTLEDFQSSKLAVLEALDEDGVDKVKRGCYVFDSDGNCVTDAKGDPLQVVYEAQKFTLSDIKIKASRDLFSREVILDDLSSKLLSVDKINNTGYKILYNAKDVYSDKYNGETKAINGVNLKFTITNEGSIVSYDDDGFVNGIVCVDANYTPNPNDVNLANMQNLDMDKVALVQADASKFDEQANTDFLGKILAYMKEHDYASWDQAVKHTAGDSILDSDKSLVKKLTKIYIDYINDDGDDPYYVVNVDVYYNGSFTYNVDGRTGTYSGDLVYNVFSQRFYTKNISGDDKCPDVYIEYQPYVKIDTVGNVQYGATDYILVDNYVEGAKIYLYKPYNDQQSPRDDVSEYYIKEDENGNLTTNTSYISQENYKYRVTSNPTSQLVNIELANASSTCKQAEIYTNISMDTYKMNVGQSGEVTLTQDETGNFSLFASYNPAKAKVETRTSANPFAGIFANVSAKDGTSNARVACTQLMPINEDLRQENRLYTITVKLTPVDEDSDANTVILTGARGDN